MSFACLCVHISPPSKAPTIMPPIFTCFYRPYFNPRPFPGLTCRNRSRKMKILYYKSVFSCPQGRWNFPQYLIFSLAFGVYVLLLGVDGFKFSAIAAPIGVAFSAGRPVCPVSVTVRLWPMCGSAAISTASCASPTPAVLFSAGAADNVLPTTVCFHPSGAIPTVLPAGAAAPFFPATLFTGPRISPHFWKLFPHILKSLPPATHLLHNMVPCAQPHRNTHSRPERPHWHTVRPESIRHKRSTSFILSIYHTENFKCASISESGWAWGASPGVFFLPLLQGNTNMPNYLHVVYLIIIIITKNLPCGTFVGFLTGTSYLKSNNT